MNLWRVGGFVGGAVDVQVLSPTVEAIRDTASQSAPVLVALSLVSGSATVGGNFVVVTGIQADGTVGIADPNPAYNRATLDDYLVGFSVNGLTVRGVITGAVRLWPRVPAAGGFLVAANGAIDIASPAGTCGVTLELPRPRFTRREHTPAILWRILVFELRSRPIWNKIRGKPH